MNATMRLRFGLGALLMVFCVAAAAQNAMTTEPADLYAGPDDEYPVVAELDSNTPIQVMGCLDDWSWCDVAVGDSRGWMYSPVISYRYEGGYVPFYSYAPTLGVAVVPFSVDIYWNRYYHERPWYPRRQEWAHRMVEHRRPPGPPPSAGPPPRPEHREGPREAARPDRPMRLGTAEPPPRHEAPQQRPDREHQGMQRPEPRSDVGGRSAPRPATPRPEEARPEQHVTPPPTPQREERAGASGRIAPPPAREERPQGAAPSPRDREDRPR
jgi:uncharacterized protein YraI